MQVQMYDDVGRDVLFLALGHMPFSMTFKSPTTRYRDFIPLRQVFKGWAIGF